MKITCGIDIIEIERIKDAIEPINNKLDDKFKERVYTEKEIRYCESKKQQKYQHYSARFSAKEAVFKAISQYLGNKFEITWKDIEVTNDKTGRPKVTIYHEISKKIEQIDISMSHCKQYAIANVVILWSDKTDINI